MKYKFTSLKLFAASVAVTSILCLPAITRADPVALYLNSSLSYISLSGDAWGIPAEPQVPGADTAHYSGTIVADYTAGVFTFTGGSTIMALDNPAGPFAVDPYPGGPLAGNYASAGAGVIPNHGFCYVNGLLSGMTLDITSGTAQHGQAPSGMTETWTGGLLTWGAYTDGGPIVETDSMVGYSGADTSLGLVSFDGYTLTLPITFHTGNDVVNDYWSGQLVAVIPEPSTLALAGVGLLGLVGLHVWRSRRSLRAASRS